MGKTDKDLIVSLLNEVRNDQKSHSKILITLKTDVKRNTDDLVEHMAQTRAVRSLTVTHRKEADDRLKRLERPFVFLSSIKKIILTAGALFGSVYGIIRLVDYFKS